MEDLRTAVERVVGTPVAGIERLSGEERRNYVGRCRLADGTTAIVKRRVRESADGARAFFDDWAGPAFLSAIPADPPHAPRFLGGDREAGLIVLEDVPHASSLVEPLTAGQAAPAETALLQLAGRLGAMQGDTAGRIDEYVRLRRELGADADARSWHSRLALGGLVDNARRGLDLLGVDAPEPFFDEVHSIVRALGEPGPFGVYLHGDPCPDNCLLSDAGLRLIDFEIGGVGHALLDGTYGEMAFPTCWCANRVPDPVVGRMEAAYRRELARGCPAALDDALFDAGYAGACAFWLLVPLGWGIDETLAEDRRWGIATVRQRLLFRAGRVARVCDERDQLPQVGRVAGQLAAALRARWPELEPLPLYPAFH